MDQKLKYPRKNCKFAPCWQEQDVPERYGRCVDMCSTYLNTENIGWNCLGGGIQFLQPTIIVPNLLSASHVRCKVRVLLTTAQKPTKLRSQRNSNRRSGLWGVLQRGQGGGLVVILGSKYISRDICAGKWSVWISGRTSTGKFQLWDSRYPRCGPRHVWQSRVMTEQIRWQRCAERCIQRRDHFCPSHQLLQELSRVPSGKRASPT